jgi:hypothetical protein
LATAATAENAMQSTLPAKFATGVNSAVAVAVASKKGSVSVSDVSDSTDFTV